MAQIFVCDQDSSSSYYGKIFKANKLCLDGFYLVSGLLSTTVYEIIPFIYRWYSEKRLE